MLAAPPGDKGSALILKLLRSSTQRVMSLTLVGMILALAVDVLLAARFGASARLDALVIALTLPQFLDTVMREGTKFALVPLLIRRREALGEREFDRRVSGLLNLALLVGAGLATLAYGGAPAVVRTIGAGLSAESRAEAADLLRLAAVVLAAVPGISLLAALLNSQRRFQLVALRNAMAPAVVSTTLLVGWRSDDLLAWVAGGYALAAAGYLALLFGAARAASLLRYDVRALPSRDDLRDVRAALSYPTAGVLVAQLSRVAERALASLAAPGGVSAYYFAFRLFSATQTLIGMSVATTSLPTLVEERRAGTEAFERSWRRAVRVALSLSVPFALVTALFHRDLVRLVYAHGAFDAATVDTTGTILLCLSLGLAVYCVHPVLQSTLFALDDLRAVGMSKILTAACNVAIAAALSAWIGLPGIALGVSIAALFGAAYMLRRVRRRPAE